MEKIELKDATGRKVIKMVDRRFSLSCINLGVLELSKVEIAKGDFANSEINKINSNAYALEENVETFAKWFYTLEEKSKEDFLLFCKVVDLIDDKTGIVFGFVERNEKLGCYELWTVKETSDKLQFPQSYYHSGMGFDGMQGKTPSISEIKKYIEENGFKRFNALEVAKEVFERFEISEEEQFQIVENKLPSLEMI